MERRARNLALASGVAYGVIARFFFGISHADRRAALPTWLVSSFTLMSVSFLFLIPFVVGILDQIAPDPMGARRPHPWLRAFFSPMVPIAVMLAVMAVFNIEGSICIAMALPIFLILAGIGGLVGCWGRRRSSQKGRNTTAALALLLPYAASPVEHHLPVPVETRRVENIVLVRAAPEIVWREIKSVRAIRTEELPFRVAHFIGLPRPVEATLSHDGPGGVRIATFERGLRFRETVTRWDPGHALSFAIQAEPAPAAALDEHVAVGGPYFDVLDGTYRLEALSDGTTRLTLTSHQRLSTRFNSYAALWTDFIMSDLQSAIMEVIRKRSEDTHVPAR